MNQLERRAIAEAVQAVLRHDARNKVSAIRNAAFFLRKKTEKTELWAQPRIAEFFTLIESQLKELEGVLGERAAPAPEPAPVTRANVANCVRVALENHPVARLAQVRCQLDEQLEAAIDFNALGLAVRSLLDNAAEALPPGGSLDISATLVDGAVNLRIEDSGPGFSQARLSRAIAPLVSTRPGQAGLGLPVAWRLVRDHGGELSLRNAEGGGAIVELRLKPA